MLRLQDDFIHTLELSKSKFICYAHRVFHEAEAKEYLLQIKKLHPDASHHCYAYVIGSHHDISRSNDDGEPSGTAGSPMLEALRLSGIHDCMCITVRYFGGIKLGAGGLVRAYSAAVSETLKAAPKMKITLVYHYQMSFGYEWIGKLDYILRTQNATLLQQDYGESVSYDFYVYDHSFLSQIQELTSNTIIPRFLKEEWIELPL